ncbi:MAG: hypothetical protein C4295_01225 [Candidatus Fervidibacterota bacterium]
MTNLSTRQSVNLKSPFNGVAGAVRWGTRLFLACGQDGLKVFELRDGVAELVAHLTDFPAFDLALRDNRLAVAAGERGVVLLDVQTLRPYRIIATNFPVHSVRWNNGSLTAHAATVSPQPSATFPL